MKILKLALLVAFLGVPINANAALVSVDWQSAGDNLITRDTVSGLDWLDLTASSNLSYDSVVAGQIAGGMFDGWRYALPAEVSAMLQSNFGIDLNNGNATVGLPPPPGLAQATALFGDSLAVFGPGSTGVSGVTGEPNGAMNSHLVVGADYLSLTQTFFRRINPNLNTFFQFDGLASEGTGHWLVADTPWQPTPSPIPVPAAIWLFGSALIGLAGLGKYRNTFI